MKLLSNAQLLAGEVAAVTMLNRAILRQFATVPWYDRPYALRRRR